jgi:PAS domain S-box-containing protein
MKDIADDPGPAELKDLADTFNQMAENLLAREKSLRESESRYAALFESTMDAIVVTDPSGPGHVISVNSAACRLFGYSEEEFLNLKNAREAMLDTNDPNFMALMEEREKKAHERAELKYKRKDGALFPADVTSDYLFDGSGNLRAVAIIRDITDRKRTEEELKRHSKELELANAELESFSYTVSHDLRSPLRAIDGFADMLLDEIGDKLDPESKRKFEVISSNSKKMAQLIDDLLIFSRMGRAAISPVNINMQDVIMDVWTELRTGCHDRDIELKTGELPEAFADRMLLRQVLSNLLGNAVKFTSEREHAVIEISGSNSGKYSTYCIKDNGAGFDMRYYDKIFEIFRRLHSEEEFEGTGVGLAIVKKIIDKHGGKIWAEGKPGEGATFCFTLPAGADYGF